MKIYSRFIELWTHPDYPPEPIDNGKIKWAESKMHFLFPVDYKECIKLIGVVGTSIKLLDAIVEGEYDIHDLSELYNMEEVVSQSMDWREIGLPEHLIAIGCDCTGNLFCLNASKVDGNTNSIIYFWDHDFNEVEIIADSFDEWLSQYNKISDHWTRYLPKTLKRIFT